jgi:hypothetical protein
MAGGERKKRIHGALLWAVLCSSSLENTVLLVCRRANSILLIIHLLLSARMGWERWHLCICEKQFSRLSCEEYNCQLALKTAQEQAALRSACCAKRILVCCPHLCFLVILYGTISHLMIIPS